MEVVSKFITYISNEDLSPLIGWLFFSNIKNYKYYDYYFVYAYFLWDIVLYKLHFLNSQESCEVITISPISSLSRVKTKLFVWVYMVNYRSAKEGRIKCECTFTASVCFTSINIPLAVISQMVKSKDKTNSVQSKIMWQQERVNDLK